MGKHHVEIFPALIDHRRQPDDLRAGADDDEKLQLPVVFKMDIRIICLYPAHVLLRSRSFYSCRLWAGFPASVPAAVLCGDLIPAQKRCPAAPS